MNKEFLEDLIKAQKEIKPIPKKGKNPHFKSEYAEYDDVVEACKAVCSKYNMFICHAIRPDFINSVTGASFGAPMLVTTIYHTSGEFIDTTMPLLNKAQTDQGMGSSISYAKRYTLVSLLAVATGDDDDGQKATQNPPVYDNRAHNQDAPGFHANDDLPDFDNLPKEKPVVKPKFEVPKGIQEKAAKAMQGPTHQHRWMISKQNPAVQFCTVKLSNGSYCKEQIIDP